jgi:hypothetical protein
MNQDALFPSIDDQKAEQENIIQFLSENDLYNFETYILNLRDNIKRLYIKQDDLQQVISSKALCFAKDYASDSFLKYEIQDPLVFSIRDRIAIPNQPDLIALKSKDLIGIVA